GSFNAFSEENISFENFHGLKELFPSLSDALKTAELIVIALEPKIMARTKIKILSALSLKVEVNQEIMTKLNNMTELSEEEKELIAKIPSSAVPFPTKDGINSGFIVKKGKQKIAIIPLDDERIDSVLRNGMLPYLMTGESNSNQVTSNNDEIAPVKSEILKKDTSNVAESTILRTINILRESDMTVSINANINAEIIRNEGNDIEGFFNYFIFTPSVEDRGDYNITDYTAQMAKTSKELTTSTFGAAISDICIGEGCKYICIALATEKSAVVRKLYMEADETEESFLKDAAEELVLLVGEKATGAAMVGIEISDDNIPTKKPFLKGKAGKITLSIIALLLVAAIIVSVILLKKQQTEREAATTVAPITTAATTVPTTVAPVVEIPKLAFSEFVYKEAVEGIKEETTTQVTQATTGEVTTTAGATTEKASANAIPKTITVNKEKLDAKEAIAKIVASEMDDSYETEAIKAQAVVVYTYLKYRDTDWNITGIKVADKYSDKVSNAVKAVFGEYLKSGNETAFTPYFLLSAGKTTTSKLAFNKPFPYLKVVDVASDKQENNYKAEKTYTSDKMKEFIAKYDSKIKLSEKPEEWLKVTKHDGAISPEAGYVETIKVGDTEISGIKFRRGVMGTEVLASHCFTIKYDAESKTFTVTSYGSGYGVGMSQRGANKMSLSKSTYKNILSKYYSGTTISE
ncbi:MAG: SpoIID/LytB domain-containing protein, partial [Oscillospiraceae bacterium]